MPHGHDVAYTLSHGHDNDNTLPHGHHVAYTLSHGHDVANTLPHGHHVANINHDKRHKTSLRLPERSTKFP